jgi:hypothetical protein
MAVTDFPSGVSDTTPTFLVGGDSSGTQLAKAACSPPGVSGLSGLMAPLAISTGTTLSSTHAGYNLTFASTHALTINTGLPVGFMCAMSGAFTFGGTATITDLRQSGFGQNLAMLWPTGPTDTYLLVGFTT